MSRRQPPTRRSERIASTHVATMLANVVRDMQLPMVGTRLLWLRGLALRLKTLRVRLRDLDQPSGQDAIAAIASTMTLKEWRGLAEDNTQVLGAKWSWIVERAGKELRKAVVRSIAHAIGDTRSTVLDWSIVRR